MEFTAHNIRLDDGTETMPGAPLIADTGICRAALRMLALCFGFMPLVNPTVRPPSVADLGCCEGGYSVAFARAGYTTDGIDAHPGNIARCQEALNGCPSVSRRLAFNEMDARHLDEFGQWDAVFCAGLLYHLDNPVAFLHMLGRVATRLLIVQTHICLDPEDEHEGARGKWATDMPGDRLGSHGNARSFWLTLPALCAAIRDAGFPLVVQQFDYLPDIAAGGQGTPGPHNPEGGPDRVMVCGIKSATAQGWPA